MSTEEMKASVLAVGTALHRSNLPVSVDTCAALVSWAMTVCILNGMSVEDMVESGQVMYRRSSRGELEGSFLELNRESIESRVATICRALEDAHVCPVRNVSAMYYFGMNGLKKNGLPEERVEEILRLAYESSASRIGRYAVGQSSDGRAS